MKNYKFTIKETLERIVEVEAPSSDAAFETVSKMYKNEEIVLTENDFLDVRILEGTLNDQGSLTHEIIDYLYNDEKKHYEEDPKPNHIFLKLKQLINLL